MSSTKYKQERKFRICGGRKMRGTGGPLLCIGDLLCDVGEENGGESKATNETPKSVSSSSSSASISTVPHVSESPDLTKLFQENYEHLDKAFDSNDHSWTALTLKMCSALETVSELVNSTNSNSTLLLEKIVELEQIMKKGDCTMEAAQAIHHTLNQKYSCSSQVVQDSSSQNQGRYLTE